jgi:hypothetical protein
MRKQILASDPMDDSIRSLKYVRYADDFLIGVIGSKEECKTVKEDIKNYLENFLTQLSGVPLQDIKIQLKRRHFSWFNC